MNQMCKVCGEPATGFHFGAFTCEGCKSFFGRSYNNLSSISECKNNSECVINKKNRTACKACRLRKCLLVGMSKSGSRYGRRSNWFKIHCLLQEQQQHQQQQQQVNFPKMDSQKTTPIQLHKSQHQPPPMGLGLFGINSFLPSLLHLPKTKEELILLGLDEYKNSVSPSVSSPESHNSVSSVEVSDVRRLPYFHPGFLPSAFLPPPGLLFPPPSYPSLYNGLLQHVNNNRLMKNNNLGAESLDKRVFLDAVLQSQRTPTPEKSSKTPVPAVIQEDPIDLSMKTTNSGRSTKTQTEKSFSYATDKENGSEADEESDCESERKMKRIKFPRPTPLDLTTKV